jgi:hypothetical protein
MLSSAKATFSIYSAGRFNHSATAPSTMLTASAASSIPMMRPMTPAPAVPISRVIGPLARRMTN